MKSEEAQELRIAYAIIQNIYENIPAPGGFSPYSETKLRIIRARLEAFLIQYPAPPEAKVEEDEESTS